MLKSAAVVLFLVEVVTRNDDPFICVEVKYGNVFGRVGQLVLKASKLII